MAGACLASPNRPESSGGNDSGRPLLETRKAGWFRRPFTRGLGRKSSSLGLTTRGDKSLCLRGSDLCLSLLLSARGVSGVGGGRSLSLKLNPPHPPWSPLWRSTLEALTLPPILDKTVLESGTAGGGSSLRWQDGSVVVLYGIRACCLIFLPEETERGGLL